MYSLIKDNILFDLFIILILNTNSQAKRTISLQLCSDAAGYPYGQVRVGGQEFKILFDTGDWTRWLPSSDSTSLCHQRKTKYSMSSPTRFPLGKLHTTWYDDGEQKGNVVTDHLFLAGEYIYDFLFDEVFHSTCRVMNGEEYDGIFGMRRPPINNLRHHIFDRTLLDYVVTDGLAEEEVFTFRFCGPQGTNGLSWFEQGDLVLGGVDDSCHIPPMVYVQLHNGEPWIILVDKIEYGAVVLCQPCITRVDTGAPATDVPEKIAEILLDSSQLKVSNYGVFWVKPRHVSTLEDLKITISTLTFRVPSAAMLIPQNQYAYYVYGLEMTPQLKEEKWNFGISLLRNFHVAFDQKRSQLGLAAVRC